MERVITTLWQYSSILPNLNAQHFNDWSSLSTAGDDVF